MLLTEFVELSLNVSDVHWYEEMGYNIPRYWSKKHKKMLIKRGTKIVVKATDLTNGSHVSVDVACDYCGAVKRVGYKDYLTNHDDKLGDCCVKCRPIKYRQTMLERYGVEHALQVPEFSDKAMHTRCENGKNPTSKPQLALFYLLLDMYKNCKLEKPCGNCSLDCVLNIDGNLIDVEYDGWFYHQDKMRDMRRDNFVKTQGYKILRVKANKRDEIPNREQIEEQVQKLLHGYEYAEIQM